MGINLYNITSAEGLESEDAALISECMDVLTKNANKHAERRDYYHDRIKIKERGAKVPPEWKQYNASTGWPRKTVNALSDRSILDGFVFSGDAPQGFDRVMRESGIVRKYAAARASHLIDGVGFWTVTLESDGGVYVNYMDATTASGIHDYKHSRMKAGFAINDWTRYGKSGLVPCECILFTDEYNVVLTRRMTGRKSTWTADYRPHPVGRCMMVPMAWEPSWDRPFGHSRITRAVKNYTQTMMSEMRDMAMQSNLFSTPMKYVLGASDEQYRGLSEDIHKAYKSEMLVMTQNEDGGTPAVGMLQGADMTPHIAVMDKLARLMASETCLPVATFGVEGKTYQSSDALRASTDDLVILAKRMNAENGAALEDVARLVICALQHKAWTALDDNESTVAVHWQDPALPSDSVRADSQIKVVSAVPEYAGTPVFWEKMGYAEDERRRIESSMGANRAAQRVVDNLFGANDGNTAQDNR